MGKSQDAIDQGLHELFIAETFVDYLAREENVVADGLRPGDPKTGEPDAVCTVAGEQRGIEVVDCWGSGADARDVWKLARDAQHRGIRGRMVASSSDLPEAEALLAHPSGDQLAAIAERRMAETMKAYGIPTWLILNASQTIAPLHDIRSGPWLMQQIRKPARCAFKDVYLCLAGSEWGRLFFRVP